MARWGVEFEELLLLAEWKSKEEVGDLVAAQMALADGVRCGSRWRTELDHVVAFALGGGASVENLRVVCRAHNTLHARRTLGADVIARHTRRSARA